MKPTPEQIQKFLDYLCKLEIFWWQHFGDQATDTDMVQVVEWLRTAKEAR